MSMRRMELGKSKGRDWRDDIDGRRSMASRFGFRAFVECGLSLPDGYKQHQGDQDSAD